MPLALTLSACTKNIVVEVAFDEGTTLTFFEAGFLSRSAISPCIWSVEIFETKTGRRVVNRQAAKGCFKSHVLRAPMWERMEGTGASRDLQTGIGYRAEIIAEEGMGTAKWIQP